MQKMIISILIVGLLLSPLSLNIAGEELVQEKQIEDDESIFLKTIKETPTLQNKLVTKIVGENTPPRRFHELEYIPGELIVKFRDHLEISISMPSEEASTTGSTSTESSENIITADITSSEVLEGTLTLENKSTEFSKEIVKTGIESIDELNMAFGVKYAEKFLEDDSIEEFRNVYLLTFEEDIDVLSAMVEYNNDPSVEYAEPNYIYQYCAEKEVEGYIQPSIIPDDPYFDMQWALHNTGQTNGTFDADIDAPESWDITMGDNDVVIAVLDTGVDYTNPDIGNYTDGIKEVEYTIESQHPLDSYYYQTFDFTEIFPELDFDAVSFHFSKIDLGKWEFGKRDLYIEVDVDRSYQSVFEYYDYRYHNGTITDIWTPYTERNKDITIFAGSDGYWGFKIDKVKLAKWVKTSQISDKYVNGYDCLNHDPYPMDDHGHGTHCAGIAAAVTDNSVGVAGVAPNCKIMPIKVGDKYGLPLSAILRGIVYAANHGSDIISMSFSGPENSFINLVLDYAYYKDVVLIAAVGNDNFNAKIFSSPASYNKVIAVAATDHDDKKAIFSNYGVWVDIAAPGCDILSLRAHGTDMYLGPPSYPPGAAFIPPFDPNAILYRCWGTSMSCPLVAGVAALVLSQNLDLTPREVRTILHSSADTVISDKYIGIGRINVHLAVQKASPVIAEFDKSMDYANIEDIVEIKGTVEGKQSEKFEGYIVEYGRGVYPTNWTLIENSDSPEDGTIATWNTNDKDEGPYVLRLCVNYNGFTYEDRTIVIVDNTPNTYYVDSDFDSSTPGWGIDHFNKIQDAVDICGDSDTISVNSGTYYEQLLIENGRSITIKSEDKDTTIIENIDKEYATIQIFDGSSLTISGFTIKSWSPLGVDWFYFAIEGYSVLNCNIYDNNFINNSGLFFYKSSFSEISENKFDNGDIAILGGKRNTISSNKIRDASISVACNHNNICNNIVTDSDSIGIGISALFNDVYNNILSNNTYGVSLDEASFSKIHDNIISNSETGIHVGADRKARFNLISQNTITNNKNGIHFKISTMGGKRIIEENVISKNIISNNQQYGIYVDTNFGNQFKNNIISENIISNNQQYGIYIRAIRDPDPRSGNNIISYNNFINNGDSDEGGNAYDEGLNIWYNPILNEGNYWDDYREKHPDAEIIKRLVRRWVWNEPYDIVGGYNKDPYPLLYQYNGPNFNNNQNSLNNQNNQENSQQNSQSQQSNPSIS